MEKAGFVPVLGEKELGEGKMKLVSVEGTPVYSLNNGAKSSL